MKGLTLILFSTQLALLREVEHSFYGSNPYVALAGALVPFLRTLIQFILHVNALLIEEALSACERAQLIGDLKKLTSAQIPPTETASDLYRRIYSTGSSIRELLFYYDSNDRNRRIALLRQLFQDIRSLTDLIESVPSTQNDLMNNQSSIFNNVIDELEQPVFITDAEALAERLNLTDREMAKLLTISIRTYHRLKPDGQLNPVASERLHLLNKLAEFGLEVLESSNALKQWLRTPLDALNNHKPLDTLDTASGIKRVENLLAQMDYGVYS